MTVAELIKFLERHPPNMLVTYDRYSEQCLLEPSDVKVYKACEPRPDGWVQNYRPDMPSRKYLGFPGN